VAAFMADVAGQIARKPAVCVSTLGPGALNLTLGVANAFLDRSPLIAITATMSTEASSFATHQQLDLNAVSRPFPKDIGTLDGVDLDPYVDPPAVRRFVEALGAPVFVTPKAKGMLPEDHPQFFGVCAGLAGDAVIVEFLEKADLLVGVGFDPVESDKLWHHT